MQSDPDGTWLGFMAFDTIRADKELVEQVIGKKNILVQKYRHNADELWLLIVNDRFLGAGEVVVHPVNIADWKFSFDFDRVLLFGRNPGGTGQVSELARA